MSLFRDWWRKYASDSHPEYTRHFFRSQEIDNERYQHHPFIRRVVKWGNIPLEEENED